MNQNIRNFSIIAHIDHGKSTLADRLLEVTGTIEKRKMKEQVLDQMDLERERGITIKMQPVRMVYGPAEIQNPKSKIQNPRVQKNDLEFRVSNLEFTDSKYILNLIDTPGHVDFSYEVSRSLAAVEGALLIVDATQGIQAQTIANLHFALEQNLVVIPIINKIDMPQADVEKTENEIRNLFHYTSFRQTPTNVGGVEKSPADTRLYRHSSEIPRQARDDNVIDNIVKISAKTGENIDKVLSEIINKVPPPQGDINNDLQILIFDSVYDNYQGVIAHVRIKQGSIKPGDKIYLIGAEKSTESLEVGIFNPERQPVNELKAGDIGYIVTGLKDIKSVHVGDTIVNSKFKNSATAKAAADRQNSKLEELKLAGYKQVKPMVFAGLYPETSEQHEELREALEKINLNDASFIFEPERSDALGPGFRAGFLGLLHLDIIKERIAREYNLELIVTTPSVEYRVKHRKYKNTENTKTQDHRKHQNNSKYLSIKRPQELPNPSSFETIEEPWVKLEIVTPAEYIGNLMLLAQERRGEYQATDYLDQERAVLYYNIPLSSILTNFYDKLKSVSSGFASLAWKFLEFRESKIIKLDILIAEIRQEALSQLVFEPDAYKLGRQIVDKLKEILPRQMFIIKIQAAIGSKIIAASKLSALRKDVTAKLYGGDVTRKRKLLEKQKKGKKRMMQEGKVEIPSRVYLEILKR